MFSRRRQQRASGEAKPPDASLLQCSFCGKSQNAVRKLIAGPSVNICDECVDICVDILDAERPLAASGPALPRARESDTSTLSRDVLICPLCKLPFPAEHLVMIGNRGPLCRPCVDAVLGTEAEAHHQA